MYLDPHQHVGHGPAVPGMDLCYDYLTLNCLYPVSNVVSEVLCIAFEIMKSLFFTLSLATAGLAWPLSERAPWAGWKSVKYLFVL